MIESDWQIAQAIARELVDRETDVNELQKAVTYARIQTASPSGKVGQKFFALLETMVRDGRYLVRSGRTLDYYRDLEAVCRKHLSIYRAATGEDGKKLVGILGWAARLMRYYNTEAGKAEMVARQNHEAASQPAVEQQPQSDVPRPQTKPSKKQLSSQLKKPPVKTETILESVTLLTTSLGRKARVQTERGEEIPCTALPAYPIGYAGEVYMADVIRENGRAVRAIFRGWK